MTTTGAKPPGTTDEAKLGIPNPAKPSLDALYRVNVYTGPAWYQRDIEIPPAWQGKRVTLFLERCRWVTTVWLDDKRIGAQGLGRAKFLALEALLRLRQAASHPALLDRGQEGEPCAKLDLLLPQLGEVLAEAIREQLAALTAAP